MHTYTYVHVTRVHKSYHYYHTHCFPTPAVVDNNNFWVYYDYWILLLWITEPYVPACIERITFSRLMTLCGNNDKIKATINTTIIFVFSSQWADVDVALRIPSQTKPNLLGNKLTSIMLYCQRKYFVIPFRFIWFNFDNLLWRYKNHWEQMSI